jgi:hypothetical protein
MRLIISNPYTGETTVLHPRGGSQLNHGNVRWLPDGPKAKIDAARKAARESSEAGDGTSE